MAADEILDVVDEQDRVIGQKSRSELYAAGQKNFRVVNAFIEDSRGRILIPRRSQERKMFPGALDTSIGGHVLAGEDYLDALVRETREECGLDLLGPDASYRLVRRLSPYELPVSAFMHFYRIHSRVEAQLCQREFLATSGRKRLRCSLDSNLGRRSGKMICQFCFKCFSKVPQVDAQLKAYPLRSAPTSLPTLRVTITVAGGVTRCRNSSVEPTPTPMRERPGAFAPPAIARWL